MIITSCPARTQNLRLLVVYTVNITADAIKMMVSAHNEEIADGLLQQLTPSFHWGNNTYGQGRNQRINEAKLVCKRSWVANSYPYPASVISSLDTIKLLGFATKQYKALVFNIGLLLIRLQSNSWMLSPFTASCVLMLNGWLHAFVEKGTKLLCCIEENSLDFKTAKIS